MVFKFTGKSEGTRTDRENLKNDMGAGLSLSDTKTYGQVITAKTRGCEADGLEWKAPNRPVLCDYIKIKTETSTQQKAP